MKDSIRFTKKYATDIVRCAERGEKGKQHNSTSTTKISCFAVATLDAEMNRQKQMSNKRAFRSSFTLSLSGRRCFVHFLSTVTTAHWSLGGGCTRQLSSH